MKPDTAARFDTEFAPRIASKISSLFDDGVHAEVLRYEGHGHPSRIHLWGEPRGDAHRYPHPLNVILTWDSDEIACLMDAGAEQRFTRYLDAIPRKFDAWHFARHIDFHSHTQAEVQILLGGLDFEA
ncbi:DUF5594 family protein [Paraburkholderia sp.]|uniref:DUF5594 family protein n=1 Tax=Paraburkholderia sp. TaxID=1926495 RepID=UPI0023936A13|nr:DUF5594 family protein [Paraburkholderia sp.]MDE1183828.1 DUF5594 family protein [Paraburkholderia sp.]